MPEEKQRKSMRTSELDKMINKLQSLERVDGTSEYYKIAKSNYSIIKVCKMQIYKCGLH